MEGRKDDVRRRRAERDKGNEWRRYGRKMRRWKDGGGERRRRRGGKETRKGDKRGGLFFLFLTSAANKHYTS